MNQAGPNPYLRTKVLTASSEELRLMLFDGALRFCLQAKKAIEEKDFEASYDNIKKAQKIVLELSSSLNHDVEPEVTEKMESLYNFMYRRLIEVNMSRDVEIIDEVMQLIKFERETWQLLVKKVHEKQGKTASAPAPRPNPAVGGYGQAVNPVQQSAISGYTQSA